MARFTRSSQNVPTFKDYTCYRPYIRNDFEFRCAYCEMTEASVFGIETFGVDHFRPKKLFPDLLCVYENLYYCCNDCNRYKGPMWPSGVMMKAGYFFLDPCACDPIPEHFQETAECRWQAITKAGAFSLEVLRLNRESCLRYRKKRRSIEQRISEYRALLHSVEHSEIRDLLLQSLDELETECAECYGEQRLAA